MIKLLVYFFYSYDVWFFKIYLYGCFFRMMANREATRRSKENKDQRIACLQHKEMILKNKIKKFYSQLPVFEVRHIILAIISLLCLNSSYKNRVKFVLLLHVEK